jgi:hypothetical protein
MDSLTGIRKIVGDDKLLLVTQASIHDALNNGLKLVAVGVENEKLVFHFKSTENGV